jgi:hypothetical protein
MGMADPLNQMQMNKDRKKQGIVANIEKIESKQ